MINDKWLFALQGSTKHPSALVVGVPTTRVYSAYTLREEGREKSGPMGREGVTVHPTRPLCQNRSLCVGGNQGSGTHFRISLPHTTATAHACCPARHMHHLVNKLLRQQTRDELTW